MKTIVMSLMLAIATVGLAERVFTLDENRSAYSNRLANIEATRTQALSEALLVYSKGLVSARVKFVNEANLDGVKAVDAAKDEAYKGNIATNTTLPEIVGLVKQYRDVQARLDSFCGKLHADLLDGYQKSLEKTSTALMKTNNLSQAEVVDAEIKRVKSLKEDIESRLVLSQTTKAIPVVKKSENPIVIGVWHRDAMPKFKLPPKDFELKEDGTFTTIGSARYYGTWKLEGETLMMEFGDETIRKNVPTRTYKVQGKTFSGFNQGMEETFKKK